MSDYRDDRGALRQRVEELESELERLEQSNKELRGALREAREPDPPKAPPEEPRPARTSSSPGQWLLIVAGLVAVWLGYTMIASWLKPTPALTKTDDPIPTREHPPPPRWDDTPAPSEELEPYRTSANTRPSDGAPFTEAASCRCEGGAAATTLAYRTLGTSVEAAFQAARPIELLLSSETVPPQSLESKKTRLLLACDARHMVLAFGERVTAWDRKTGDAMWIATLPARVGTAEPGEFKLECVKLPVTAGAISVGGTRLDMADGEPVENPR